MSTDRKTRIKIAILVAASLSTLYQTSSTILADLQACFPEVPVTTIQMVLSLPSLVASVINFAIGIITGRFSKKRTLQFGLLCGFSAGLVALLFGPFHIGFVLMSSLLVGVALGCCDVMASILIAEHFIDQEKSRMMGLQTSAYNFTSLVFLPVAGFLALVQWNFSYLVDVWFFVAFLVVSFFLPKDDGAPKTDAGGQGGAFRFVNGRTVFVFVVMTLYGISLLTFHSNVSFVIAENGWGDAGTTSFVMMTLTFFGIIGGVCYGRLRKAVGCYSLCFALLFAAVALVVSAAAPSLPWLFVAAACAGTGISFMMASGADTISASVVPAVAATALGVFSGLCDVGCGFSPVVINAIAASLGGGVTMRFIVGAVILGTLLVASVFVNRAFSRSDEERMLATSPKHGGK